MISTRKLRIILALFVVVIAVAACGPVGRRVIDGSGDVVEETIEVDSFSGVNLATIGSLFISLGDEEELLVEAEENLIPQFQAEVEEGILIIDTESNVSLRPTAPVNFYLTVTEIDSASLTGSGNIDLPDIDVEQFSATISGSGNIEMGEISGTMLEIQIPGSGDLRIAGGSVEEQTVTISGSGIYEARSLMSEQADVSIAGSGSTTLHVTEELAVNITGSGTVRYRGTPSLDRMTISGSGSVEQIEQ